MITTAGEKKLIERMTPVDIDRELSRLWEARAVAEAKRTLQGVPAAAGAVANHNGVWTIDGKYVGGSAMVELARAVVKDMGRYEQVPGMNWSAAQIQAEIDRWDAATSELAAIFIQEQPYTAEFERRGGWRRYFLVTNPGGHVHRGMQCSTCYATTAYRWLIDLADCDETAMVEQYGETACTVCFPDAPTMPGWTRSVEERQAAEAKKNADRCPGSGKSPEWAEGTGKYNRYQTCTGCGTKQTVTQTGLVRAHKKPKAKPAVVGTAIPVPEGPQTVEGLVSKISTKENADGSQRFVMTVRDDRGFSVWGTRPLAIAERVQMGTRVRFDAELARSAERPHFGFFRYPKNVVIL